MFKPWSSVLGHPGMEWLPWDHDYSCKLLFSHRHMMTDLSAFYAKLAKKFGACTEEGML